MLTAVWTVLAVGAMFCTFAAVVIAVVIGIRIFERVHAKRPWKETT
jgi:hypothetical protein